MNNESCLICGHLDSQIKFKKNGYTFFECLRCASWFVLPVPSNQVLSEFYNKVEDHLELGSRNCWSENLDSHRHMWDVWQESLKHCQTLIPLHILKDSKIKLLDIGCGSGQFLAFVTSKNWNLTGVEWNQKAAQTARKLSSGDIFQGDIFQANFPDNAFTVITMWDVIEHLNNFSKVLEEVYRLLQPGGILLIGTPHRHGLTLKILGKLALTVNPPEHILFFSQTGLQESLTKYGFNVIQQWSFSIYLREWFHLLKKSSKDGSKTDKDYVQNRVSFLHSSLGQYIIKIANFILRFLHLGDQLMCIAQKPYKKIDNELYQDFRAQNRS